MKKKRQLKRSSRTKRRRTKLTNEQKLIKGLAESERRTARTNFGRILINI